MGPVLQTAYVENADSLEFVKKYRCKNTCTHNNSEHKLAVFQKS